MYEVLSYVHEALSYVYEALSYVYEALSYVYIRPSATISQLQIEQSLSARVLEYRH